MTKGVLRQNIPIHLCKGIAVRSGAAGGNDEAREFITDALFATLTNVNFDAARFREMIDRTIAIRDAPPPAGGDEPDACTWTPENDDAIMAGAREIAESPDPADDLRSLTDLLVFGVKGLAAHYHHAALLGYTAMRSLHLRKKPSRRRFCPRLRTG